MDKSSIVAWSSIVIELCLMSAYYLSAKFNKYQMGYETILYVSYVLVFVSLFLSYIFTYF